FKGELPALELVFRRSLQKYGLVRACYYDNGQVYRSHHMRQIIATLGIHRLVFTQKRRPEGHGKIEALNRLIRSAFLAELKSSRIETLDALNEAFLAWMDVDYNRRPHSEAREAPGRVKESVSDPLRPAGQREEEDGISRGLDEADAQGPRRGRAGQAIRGIAGDGVARFGRRHPSQCARACGARHGGR